jgi:hypothetical protein
MAQLAKMHDYTPLEIVSDTKKFWTCRLSKKHSTFGTGHRNIIPDNEWTSDGWEQTKEAVQWKHRSHEDCVQNGRPHLQRSMGREILNPSPLRYSPTQNFDSRIQRAPDVSFNSRPKDYKPSLFVPSPTFYTLPGSLTPEPLVQSKVMAPSATNCRSKDRKYSPRTPGPAAYHPDCNVRFPRPRTVDLERPKKGFPRTTIAFGTLQVFEDYKNEVNSRASPGEDPHTPGPQDYGFVEPKGHLSTSRPCTRDIRLKGKLPLLGQRGTCTDICISHEMQHGRWHLYVNIITDRIFMSTSNTDVTKPGPADYDPYSRCDAFEGPRKLSNMHSCQSFIQRKLKYEKKPAPTTCVPLNRTVRLNMRVRKNYKSAYSYQKKPFHSHAKTNVLANEFGYKI